ncbi:Hypothetical predicted protein, partial [Paramuricea clavata]
SLEERLADDVYELMNCLDTGIVTSGVKALIKLDSTTNVADGNNKVNHEPGNSINNFKVVSLISPNITNRSLSCWSGLKSKLSSMESDQMLFRERMLSQIMELKTKVTELDSTIQVQNAEIKQLKSENERLPGMHPSSNNMFCNNKSISKSQESSDHVGQDKNLSKENEDIVNNYATTQNVLNVGCYVKQSEAADEVSNRRPNKEQNQKQESKKPAKSKGNNTKSSSIVSLDDEFIGVQRNRVKTKRYYIGGIAETTKKETILQYLNGKGISPTLFNLFTSRRKGTLSAKMNVHAEDVEKMIVEDF